MLIPYTASSPSATACTMSRDACMTSTVDSASSTSHVGSPPRPRHRLTEGAVENQVSCHGTDIATLPSWLPTRSGGWNTRMKTVTKWTTITITSACLIVMFLMIKPFLLSTNGTFGPTILQSQFQAAIAAMLATMAVGTFIACIVSRILGTQVAGQCRWSSGTRLRDLVEHVLLGLDLAGPHCAGIRPDRHPRWLDGPLGGRRHCMGIDTAGLAFIVCRFGGVFITPMQNDDGIEDDQPSPAALKMAAVASAFPVVWLVAQSPMKGQVLAATIIGATAAGLVGRLLARPCNPSAVCFVCVFGALGQWVADSCSTDLAAVASNQLPNIVLPCQSTMPPVR